MRLFILISFFIFSGGLFGQSHIVTNSDPDGSGSLAEAINLALINAAGGMDVTIYLNVPDVGADGKELIPVSSPLPIINNINGSITIKPYPSAVIQGLELDYPGDEWGDAWQAPGFYIAGAEEVVIEDLHFENFHIDMPKRGVAIYMVGSDNITVHNNTFINCDYGLDCQRSGVDVNENNFSEFNTAIFCGGLAASTALDLQVEIANNTMIGGDSFLDPDGIVIVTNKIRNEGYVINNNYIASCRNGTTVSNHVSMGQNADVHIFENEIHPGHPSSHGINLWGPKSDWNVENNILTGLLYGITVSDNGNDEINDLGIDFIQPNTIGETPINTGNIIENCGVSFQCSIRNRNQIIGYSVDGYFQVKLRKPTVIRENLINTTYYSGVAPIRLLYGGNDDFDALTLNAANLSGSTLTIDYTISGALAANGNFVIEFFEANSDWELLQFIDSEIKTVDDTYTATFTDFMFESGTLIGATITSLGDPGSTELGTSEVEYISTAIGCDTCNSFKPVIGNTYWLSAWTKVGMPSQVKTYAPDDVGPNLELQYFGSVIPSDSFYPTGEIIDGWQRIVGKFTVPSETLQLRVILNSDVSYETYFDDIRIHPFNGSMKSYVYDGETFWLTSELDDNNYATFYEYDQEGGLIRIKKETSRGIVTIQETRSGTIKD